MKRNILFILFWISIQTSSEAQNASQSMLIAESLIKNGDDVEARNLFQRVLFFDRKTYGKICYQHLAYINFRLGSYTESEFFFDLMYQNATSDSIRYESLIGKSGALLMQQKFTAAKRELLNLPTNLPEKWNSRKLLYLGSALYGERNFDQAEQTLLALIPETDTEKQRLFKKQFNKARKINAKNPQTAKWLSIIIPGSGQFYAGDLKNGLNSMGLNAVMAWWFIYTIQKTSLNDAILSTGSWVFRYYAGGYKRAAIITEEQKTKKLNNNYQVILSNITQ